jgi:DNA (cytosine-5)-methyltransferase 1
MSIVGLFAGIGGLELGFAQAGFRTRILSEIDPTAKAILERRFPDTEVIGNVTDLTALPSETTIVTAGFPCQNLSMAGDKRGIDGTKSGIISELFRLIEGADVPLIVIENVYFMLQLDRGRAMHHLTSRFEELGYHWAYRILDTLGFGLPQRRRRVYLVASSELDPRSILFADEAEAPPRRQPTLDLPLGFYWTEGRSGVGMTVDAIPPLKGGSAVGIPSPPAVLFPDGSVLIPSLTACELLQGFEPGWTSTPETVVARRPEWKLLGNAVSVPVAAWLASRTRNPGSPLDLPTGKMQPDDRWPDAAFNVGSGRTRILASDKPVNQPCPSIGDFRDDNWSQLSERALTGFVNRAIEGGLRFPQGFIQALRRAQRRARVAA